MSRRRNKRRRPKGTGEGWGIPSEIAAGRSVDTTTTELVEQVNGGRIDPAARTVYGVERYTDPLQSGTPRQLLPKRAITLNGSTEYASTDDNGKLLPFNGGATYTFTAWVNLTTSGDALFSANGEVNGGWAIYVNATTLRFLAKQGSGAGNALIYDSSGFTSITGTGWRHIAVAATIDADGNSGGATFWLDGGLLGTSTVQVSGGYADGSQDFTIGCRNKNTNFLDGSADDLRVYSGALTDSQIADLAAIAPGSQRGANVGSPLIHYKCEDPVTSATLRNSGSLGSVADATITTAALATVRGTASPVYSFANSVGGSQAWCSDGSDDYLDSQITLNGATAFTVWRRMRYLSTDGYDIDGFQSTTNRVELGRTDGTELIRRAYGTNSTQDTTISLPNGQTTTTCLTSDASGYSLRSGGVEVQSGATGGFTIASTESFYIGATQNHTSGDVRHSHAEYYEYLIADRVLTDDELTWLETGGQAGTAIDFEGDANILLYTDFSDQTATSIRNHANANLPILKASGSAAGELTMVPRSESDTMKDVDQAEYSYRTAVYLPGTSASGSLVFSGAIIPATADFDISFEATIFANATLSTNEALLCQYTTGTDGRLVVLTSGTKMRWLIGDAGGDMDITSADDFTYGKRHTYRITRVGDTYTLYMDGVQQAQDTVSGLSVEQVPTALGAPNATDTTLDGLNGLISNIDFGNANQYLTTPNETISGATLTNASYVDVVRGKPGTIQHTGIAPRDMPLSVPCVTLNGSSDYVALETLTDPDLAATAWDITFGINGTDTSSFQSFLTFANTSDENEYLLIESGDATAGKLRVRARKSGGTEILDFETNIDVLDGVDHIVRVVHDGSQNVSIYVDGSLDAQDTMSDTSGLVGQTVTLGALRRTVAGVTNHSDIRAWGVSIKYDGVTQGSYPLTEGSGDVAHDVSGNGNHGAINGTLANIWANQTNVPGSGTLVADGYSVGQWFDGSSDSLERDNLVSGATRFCISVWVNPAARVQADAIVSEYNTVGNQRSWQLVIETSGAIAYGTSDDGTSFSAVTTTSTIADGELVHVSVVDDAGNVTIRVNGTEWATTGSVETPIAATTAKFEIGARDNAGAGTPLHLEGVVSQLLVHKDPVAVWTAEQEAAISAAGKTSEIASIVSDLGGTAWYFPDAKTETLKNLAALSVNGAPEQRVIPAGTGLPAISYGPGILPPGCSLDLYCNEDDAPVSQLLSGDLTDGDYDFGDGQDGDSLYAQQDDNSESLATLYPPRGAGAQQQEWEAWAAKDPR